MPGFNAEYTKHNAYTPPAGDQLTDSILAAFLRSELIPYDPPMMDGHEIAGAWLPSTLKQSFQEAYTSNATLLESTFKSWESWAIARVLPLLQQRVRKRASRLALWSHDYLMYADFAFGHAAFIVLASGFLGLALGNVKAGDQIVLARGARLPIVLRRRGETWAFCSFAYIHGMDFAKLLDRRRQDGAQLEDFVLT